MLSPERAQLSEDNVQFGPVLNSVYGFIHRHPNLNGVPQRPRSVIDFVNRVRSSEDLTDPLPNTLIDIIDWKAWKDLWFYHQSSSEEEAVYIKLMQFAAEQRVYSDIAQLDGLSDGSPDTYADLLDSFYLARLAVKNPQGIIAAETRIDKIELGGMLATHKVAKALQSTGFSRTRLANMAERDYSTDVVVPLGRLGKRLISLKVQPSPDFHTELRTVPTHWGTLLIYTPYDAEGPNYFDLSAEDKSTLHISVNQLRAGMLAFRVLE